MRRRISTMLALGVLGVGMVVGVGANHSIRAYATQKAPKDGGTAIFVSAPMDPFVDNLNPFSPNNPVLTSGMATIYETLFYFNQYTGTYTPKLATGYTFSKDHRTLTFQIRNGVKWSDGKPFTANDVVFSLNLVLTHPDVDTNGLSSIVKSVSASGNTVTVKLKTLNNSALLYIGANTFILPQHVWSKASDPAAFVDKNPVTTGPFLLDSFSQSLITLKKNPNYWDTGKPHIDKIKFPLYLDNNAAAFAMAQGKFDAAVQFVPNIQATLLSKDPSHYHDWFPPIGDRVLLTNDKKYPMSLTAFRQAMNVSIDRVKMTNLGEYGYEKPLDSTAIPPAVANQSIIDQSLVKQYPLDFNPAKAKSILKTAGFKWDSSGNLMDPHGKPVSLTILATKGATNQVADAQVIAEGLRQIGININVQTPTSSTISSERANGSFDMMMYSDVQPTAYMDFNTILNSSFSAPIGKPAVSDYERWTDKTTDNLLNQYAQTFDPAQQKAIMFKLEKIVAEQVPFIPLCNFPGWEEYNTAQFDGWPSASNPYASFASSTDSMYVLATIYKH